FLATSTNGIPNTTYTFSTSTASIAGTNKLTDSTAFVFKASATDGSYFNAGPLQVDSGTVQTTGYFYGSANNFIQSVIQNTNAGNNASADFVACNNLSPVLWPLGTNCPTYFAD